MVTRGVRSNLRTPLCTIREVIAPWAMLSPGRGHFITPATAQKYVNEIARRAKGKRLSARLKDDRGTLLLRHHQRATIIQATSDIRIKVRPVIVMRPTRNDIAVSKESPTDKYTGSRTKNG